MPSNDMHTVRPKLVGGFDPNVVSIPSATLRLRTDGKGEPQDEELSCICAVPEVPGLYYKPARLLGTVDKTSPMENLSGELTGGRSNRST